MRRYFFQIRGERGMDEDLEGLVLPGHSAAMLHAVTMCAELGCSGGFDLGFAVCVRNEQGCMIGRVTVVVANSNLERPDA